MAGHGARTDFLDRPGRAAALLRAVDWGRHPLGDPGHWPAALGTALAFILASPESMFLAWGEQQHFFFNDAYLPILGPRLDRAMGARFPDLWADAWPAIAPLVARTLAGEGVSAEDMPITIARRGEPEQTFWTFSFSPWPGDDGAVAGLFCLVDETTLRVRDRRLRHDADTRNRQILDSAADYAIVATGPDGLVTDWNAGAVRVLGWTEDEMLGRPLDCFFTPEDVAADRPATEMRDALATGAGRDERWHRRKSGERFWANGEMTVLRDDAGTATGFVKVLRDRTEQRRISEELRALNTTLEERVLQEVGARLRTEDALHQSQKVEAIGRLTGGVAHDFNNLLTVIRGSVDLLRRPGIGEERRRRYIDAIADTADRAVKLTGQLLAFARRQALRPEVFDAGRNITALGGMLESLTGSGIDIVIDACDAPCFVDADPSQFDTALINMAVNARDAMAGQGRLGIALASVGEMPGMRAHPAIAGDFVAISVTDTGTGIAPDALARIFEPFFTTKDVGKGTGLGLSQVFGFAKQSGGNVVAGSTPGEGATFTLYLPQVAPPEDAPGAPAAPAPDQGSLRVLVVEDNRAVGEFAVQALGELGHETVLAGDAAAALAELANDAGRFDIVLSDVVMPGMSGLDLADEIVRRHPGLPVILASGYSTVLAERGTNGVALLHKPYSLEDLARALRQAMRTRGR